MVGPPDYLGGKKLRRWWSRSNTFDHVIILRLAEYAGRRAEVESALEFWRVRDTRTFIDAKLDFPKINGFIPVKDESYWAKAFVQHSSKHDIAADVLRMQTITRLEHDLEQTER
jgi:hypothetical protein